MIHVDVLDPITANLTWKNTGIPPGTTIQIGYLLGKYSPEHGTVVIHCFRVYGVLYDYGAMVTVSAPSSGSTRTEQLPSYISHDWEYVYDVICFISKGTLRRYADDCLAGPRGMGLMSADVRGMEWLARQDFYDVLGVSQAPDRWTDTIGFNMVRA